MLPDFPELKKRINTELNNMQREAMRSDPLFSQIGESRVFEGDRLGNKPADGPIDESPFEEMSGEYSVNAKDVIAQGIGAFAESRTKIAQTLREKQAGSFFEGLSRITKKTGNIVDSKGSPFSFDSFIELLDKMWIDFDESGQPRLPSIIVGPQLGEEIKKMMPIWHANQEYAKRFDELIERKRKEWNDRESNRKLVD